MIPDGDIDVDRERVLRAVRDASSGWAEAMRTHKLAPPDARSAGSLRGVAEATAREQLA